MEQHAFRDEAAQEAQRQLRHLLSGWVQGNLFGPEDSDFGSNLSGICYQQLKGKPDFLVNILYHRLKPRTEGERITEGCCRERI